MPAADHHDPQRAAVVRKTLLDKLATDRQRVIGFHLHGFGSTQRLPQLQGDGVGGLATAGAALPRSARAAHRTSNRPDAGCGARPARHVSARHLLRHGGRCAQAMARGLTTVGVDFAPAMISEALSLFPNLDFRVGDAEALHFPDESFDAAVCAFGLLHLPNAERGLAEAYRVIKRGSAYAFSVWCTPEKARLFGLLMDAVTTYSDATHAQPRGPSFFQFSDPAAGARALERTGFRDVSARELTLVYEGTSIDEFLDWFEKSTVRVSILYRLQDAEVRARIRGAIASAANSYVTDGRLRILARSWCFLAVNPHRERATCLKETGTVRERMRLARKFARLHLGQGARA